MEDEGEANEEGGKSNEGTPCPTLEKLEELKKEEGEAGNQRKPGGEERRTRNNEEAWQEEEKERQWEGFGEVEKEEKQEEARNQRTPGAVTNMNQGPEPRGAKGRNQEGE